MCAQGLGSHRKVGSKHSLGETLFVRYEALTKGNIQRDHEALPEAFTAVLHSDLVTALYWSQSCIFLY